MLKDIIYPFKKWWQFILANLLLGFIIVVSFNNNLDTPLKMFLGTLWAFLIGTTQWLGHTYFQIILSKKVNWLEQPLKRFVLTLLAVVLYSMFAFFVVQIIMHNLVFGETPEYLTSFNYDYWSFPVYVSSFIALVFSAIGFFRSWKNEVVEKEKMKNEMLSYKYESLRNQINPHFMFNSLNVLADLVYEDQKTAVKFIHQFSDIYRYVLDSREKELMPLSEELEFVNKYIYLLKIRFENKLMINIENNSNNNPLIVPLALQLLIENAIKHNEVSTKNNLVIKVNIENDYLSVSNKILKKNIGETSKQIGLKNLTQQFSYFTDKEVTIVEVNNEFIVKIPLIKV